MTGPAPVLWYPRPATDWEREGLPIGNGALGAVVFGGVGTERLQLNEKSLWTGGPGAAEGYDSGNWLTPRPGALAQVRRRIDEAGALAPDEVAARLGQPRRGYGAYQHFADLYLDLHPDLDPDLDPDLHPDLHPDLDPDLDRAVPGGTAGPVRDYRRELDLGEAVARVRYTAGGITYRREFFASYPGNVVVARLTADRPGAVAFTLRLVPGPDGAAILVAGGRLTLHGALADNGRRYEGQVRVLAAGGTRVDEVDRITVTGAHSAVLIWSAGTDYAPGYPGYRDADPHSAVTAAVDAAAALPYPALRQAHRGDYRALFDRVALDIGQVPPQVPTDALLAGYTGGGAAVDRALEALAFDYGRYLLIASSRPGSLPANLQGVWNDSAEPAWSADYHPNINLQMNYWPAQVTNLAETAAPLHDFIDALRPPGRVTAREMFDSPGWVVHNETNPYGFTGVHDWPTAFWFPEAAAWLASQMYEHYRFTAEVDFLRGRAYPVLREVAEFWLANLHPDPRDGTLVVSPSYSPEHGDYTAGAAMSQQIVWDLLANTVEAAGVLGVDAGLVARLRAVQERLDPGLRVGSWGQLQEWKADLDDPADTHRHVSHLFALHPGRQLDPLAAPALGAAAALSLRARGTGETGWSKAWKISSWARLRDGDQAHRMLAALLRGSTLPNLWDTHPPFQIDGNLGTTAGVAEMLVQSHLGVVDVLPALPAVWPHGSVTGLRARGGLTVDIAWRDREVTALVLTADHSGPVTVRCPLLARRSLVDAEAGQPVPLRWAGGAATFAARASHRYHCPATPTAPSRS